MAGDWRFVLFSNQIDGAMMGKSGRKRKAGMNRYKDGSIVKAERGETEAQVMTTVMMQRFKIGATNENFRDQKWGDELGRLFKSGEIDDTQYEAIKRAISIRHRYRVTQGFPAEAPRCISGEFVTGGSGAGREFDEEYELECRRAYADMNAIFSEYQGRGVEYQRVIRKMALDEALVWPEAGTLREAGNLLARRWGMM